MTSVKKNQENYNRWSSSYDNYPNPTVAIDDLYFPDFYKSWNNEDILEIGCGTGRHTQRLVAQGNSVVGLDVSDGMLEKAREKLPETKFIHGDFMCQSIEKNSFNKIIMSLVLEHISDLEIFFQKVNSILKEDGEILISEIHPKRSEQGALAHFKTPSGEEIYLSSITHSEDKILEATRKSGMRFNYKKNINGDDRLSQIHEKWSKYQNKPMIQIWSFKKNH